jgi:hypothetical protein
VTSEDEIRDFQRVFPASPASALLGKIIAKLEEGFDLQLRSLSVGNDSFRQAQGGSDALNQLVAASRYFMNVNIENMKDEDEKEEEVEDVPDIGY